MRSDSPPALSSPRPSFPLEALPVLFLGAMVVLGAVDPIFRPVVSRVWSAGSITRQGPNGFPATVAIRDENLQISNASDEPWTCTIRIGSGLPYESIFDVPARGTSLVPFSDFRLLKRMSTALPFHDLAVARMQMECREPSGLTHFSDL